MILSFSQFLREDYKTAKAAFLKQEPDATKVDAAIAQFRKHQNSFKGNEKNIDWWEKQGWNKFNVFIAAHNVKTTKDFLTLRSDDEWLIVVPLNKEASCYHGGGTDWCTTKENHEYFSQYFYNSSHTKLHVVLIYCIKNPHHKGLKEKWAIVPYFNDQYQVEHPKTYNLSSRFDSDELIEYFDRRDKPLNRAQFESQTGLTVEEILDITREHKNEIEQRRKTNRLTDYASLINDMRGLNRDGSDKELISPLTQEILYREIPKRGTNDDIIMFMEVTGIKNWPEVEPTLFKTGTPHLLLQYFKLSDNKKLAPLVKTSIEKALRNKEHINFMDMFEFMHLEHMSEWPEIEPSLLKMGDRVIWDYMELSGKYAWPEGEKELLKWKSPDILGNYARVTHKKEWPDAEKLVLLSAVREKTKDPIDSYEEGFSKKVDWEKYEPLLLSDNAISQAAIEYMELFNKTKPWPELEEKILRDLPEGYTSVNDVIDYMTLVKKSRWPEAAKLVNTEDLVWAMLWNKYQSDPYKQYVYNLIQDMDNPKKVMARYEIVKKENEY